ncbi:MAG: M15 family metallopeptidase [Alistipes sp.]
MRRLLFLLLIGVITSPVIYAQSTFDTKMLEAGLVDIQKKDTTLRVKLMYSTPQNFVGRDLYGELEKAYLQPKFAAQVIKAQKLLRKLKPGYRLLICDAARPISVQRTMYALVAGTPNQVYVANGDRGGRHNYGVAVDLTIIDATGEPIDMGTPVDFFGDAAHLGHEKELIAAGKITAIAAQNRALLLRIMRQAGLVPYRREWWHFEEPITMTEVREKYKLLNF